MGFQQGIFPVGDSVLRRVDQLFIQLRMAHQQLFQQVAAIFLVENREARLKAQGSDLAADYI